MQTYPARAALGLFAALTSLVLAGCGGKSTTNTNRLPGPVTSASMPQLPPPAQLLRDVSYADPERFMDASMFGAALPNHGVTTEGASLRFSSNWDTATGAHDIAYAVYSWTLAGYTGQHQVGVVWGEAPAAGVEVWAGAADWQDNRWFWSKLDGANVASFLSDPSFVKADGSIMAVIAVLGPAAAAHPLANTVFVGEPTSVTPGDQTFTVDLSGVGTPISPLVYGTNEITTPGSQTAKPALVRFGGNRYTAYNWENNASNAGNDYFNENDDYFGADDTPGAAVQSEVQSSYDAEAQSVLVTVPIQGYVAADKNGGDEFGSGDVINSGANYLDTRFKVNKALKGAALSNPPDSADGFVYQDEFVNWLNTTYPGDLTSGKLLVSLDNEPDLWADTHYRIQTVPLTYAALLQKNIDYAAAVKSVVPGAKCFGAVNFGYSGYVNLQGAPDAGANPPDFITYYLAGMKAAEATHGNKRLLDVLDVHFYTEAEAGKTHTNQYAGSDDLDAATVAARLQAPRSLWDSTYIENSWITRDYQPGTPVDIIHWLQSRINSQYPGTKLAITEYNYGASQYISGGLAEADALGIFGREGLYAATYFALNDSGDPYVYGAMQLYRNYDGNGGKFGEFSMPVAWNDRAGFSAYAGGYLGQPEHFSLLLINKQSSAQQANIVLSGSPHHFSFASAYTLTEAGGSHPVQVADVPINGATSFNATLPPMSVTLLLPYELQ